MYYFNVGYALSISTEVVWASKHDRRLPQEIPNGKLTTYLQNLPTFVKSESVSHALGSQWKAPFKTPPLCQRP